MKTRNSQTKLCIYAIMLAILIIIITAIVTYVLKLGYSQMIATAGLLFVVAAFALVLLNLNATYVQLRKSMAKPQLKVALSEDGKTEAIIDIPKDEERKTSLSLWIINTGNAVTRLFQIDFEIPDIFDPELKGSIGGRFLPYETIRPSSNGNASEDTRIISFCNDWDFCVFVNSPVEFLTLSLKSLPQNYEDYEEEYEIRYRVYGDWAETQEGKLKVICKKKQEVF